MSALENELRLLTLAEAAGITQVSKRTLLKMIQQKKVPAFKIGRQWRIRAGQLKEWLEREEKTFGFHLGIFLLYVLSLNTFLFFQQASAQETRPPASSDLNKIEVLADTKVRVERFRITGNTAVAAEELAPIVAPFTGKDIGFSELKGVADLITDAYRKKGYTIARAYIPQQEIRDGVVEIAVIEGRFGEIVIRGNKHYSTDFIRGGFTRVIEDKAIKHSSLETSLFLLNENPDLKATAVLEGGKGPGTTDIIVNVEDRFPLRMAMDYNNFGSRFVSRHRFGSEISFGNFFIEGSSFSVRGVMGSEPSDFLFGRAFYLLPVNTLGTKLGVSSSGGNFEVGRELAELDIKGKTWSYGISLTHPFIKARFQNLSGEFGFESKDSKQFLLGSLSSRDKIKMLKAGLNYDRTDSTGRNFISFYLLQGLGDALGGMENNDPMSSRRGADNRFTKANLNLARLQRISDSFSLLLRSSGVVSTDSLVAGEQFLIGGSDSVRGYPQGEFLGDDGYNVSTELRVSPLPNKEIAQMALFVDHGGVSIKNPPVGTKSYRHLTGVGLGLRLNLGNDLNSFNMRFDVGFPVQPSKASSEERPTFYIQAAVRF